MESGQVALKRGRLDAVVAGLLFNGGHAPERGEHPLLGPTSPTRPTATGSSSRSAAAVVTVPRLVCKVDESRAGPGGPSAGTRGGLLTQIIPVAHRLESVFAQLRKEAGLQSPQGARWQPRLHDLRHTFAVNRLIAWYREGADVQSCLPFLSTYLGHANISGTQAYLTMTPELLTEASKRFARYAVAKEGDNDND